MEEHKARRLAEEQHTRVLGALLGMAVEQKQVLEEVELDSRIRQTAEVQAEQNIVEEVLDMIA